jgi:hypothetical protein
MNDDFIKIHLKKMWKAFLEADDNIFSKIDHCLIDRRHFPDVIDVTTQALSYNPESSDKHHRLHKKTSK